MTPRHPPQVRSLYKFGNRFGLKSIKVTGAAVSADEEAAASFPVSRKVEIGYDVALPTVPETHWRGGPGTYPLRIACI